MKLTSLPLVLIQVHSLVIEAFPTFEFLFLEYFGKRRSHRGHVEGEWTYLEMLLKSCEEKRNSITWLFYPCNVFQQVANRGKDTLTNRFFNPEGYPILNM